MNLYQWFRLNPYKKRATEVEAPAVPEAPKYVSQFSAPASDERYKNYADYLDALAGPQDRTPTEDAKMADYAQHLDSMAKPGYGDLEPHPAQPELPASGEGTFGVLASDRNPEAPEAPKAEPNAFLSRFQPPKIDLDFGKGTNATQENLRAAQQSRSNTELMNQLGKAAELIGTGLGRTKAVAGPLFDENIKRAGQPVQELEERIALEKKDPNSPYSQGFREYLKRFGVNVSGDFSGEQGEKMVPWALSQYNNELHRQTQKEINANSMEERKKEFEQRAEELKTRREELKEHQKQLADDKQKAQDEKAFQKLNDLTNPANASSRKVLGQAGTKIQTIEGALALMDGKDLDKLTNPEYAETVRVLDRVLSNSAPTIYGQKKLAADTAASRIAKFIEFFANDPQAAHYGKFLDRTRNTLLREAVTAEQQVMKNVKTVSPFFKGLETRNPDQFKEALDSISSNIFTPRTLELVKQYKQSQEASPEAKMSISNVSNQMVKVRRKRDGVVKTLDSATAQKYLADPSKFEQVQ